MSTAQRAPTSRSGSSTPPSAPSPRACARHWRYPCRAANAPMMAVTHHTAIAQDASSGERSPIAAPNAV